MELTQLQIEKINEKCPYEQGIFIEPYGCDGMREPLLYMRWKTGGITGGSCWEGSNPQPYTSDDPKPRFVVLTLTIKELKPDLTFLEYEEIMDMVVSTDTTDWEYYGNCTNYGIEYLKLSDLIKKLEEFENKKSPGN
jgi:hypothetical protein